MTPQFTRGAPLQAEVRRRAEEVVRNLAYMIGCLLVTDITPHNEPIEVTRKPEDKLSVMFPWPWLLKDRGHLSLETRPVITINQLTVSIVSISGTN